MLGLIVKLGVYGAVLWNVFRESVWSDLATGGDC